MWHFGGWIKDITEPPGGEVEKSSFLCKSRQGVGGGGEAVRMTGGTPPANPLPPCDSLFKCCGSLCADILAPDREGAECGLPYIITTKGCFRPELYVAGNMLREPRT